MIQRSGDGQFRHSFAWEKPDEKRWNVRVGYIGDDAASFVNRILDGIEREVGKEYDFPCDDPLRDSPDLEAGDEYVFILDGAYHMVSIARGFYAFRRWRLRLRFTDAPLMATGRKTEIALTAAQFRKLPGLLRRDLKATLALPSRISVVDVSG